MLQKQAGNIICKAAVTCKTTEPVCHILSDATGLSRTKIKGAMNKGAVWIKRGKGKTKRLRRASMVPLPGDRIEIYYDEATLARTPPEGKCLEDLRHYSVWFKPVGLLAQGTQYGDHCALTRQAELYFKKSREIFLVHRLDREASGLMLLAHTKEAATKLSALFQKNQIIKQYQIEVLGDLFEKSRHSTIELPLDGKPSVTEFTVKSYAPESGSSIVDVRIKTGRLHQIRRHFAMIGFPVIGDPRYGEGNKNTEGMKLSAESLSFQCPFQNREVTFTVPEP